MKTETTTLRQTPLHGSHLALGAKMGGFAGYDMPLYYKSGAIAEHEWTRSHAGLFDVSHMGQITIEGAPEKIIAFWERVTPSGFAALKDRAARYTVLTNESGGIIDDLIVTRLAAERFFAVLNAGRKIVDLDWLRRHLPPGLDLHYAEGHGLIALQGPRAEAVLREVCGVDAADFDYMSAHAATLEGAACLISRLGYTGEDGFEISAPAAAARSLWDRLSTHEDVKPVGLAARDSLRLEMGYPLYGHDIDETTSPAEAALHWILRKDMPRPTTTRARAGVRLLERVLARGGEEIQDESGRAVGTLTSGGFSPILKQSIGQGYIESAMAAPGTKIFVMVRGRSVPAEVASMPFVPAKTKSIKRKAA